MLRIVIGTYSHLLYGVDVDLEKKESKPLWLFEAHESALTALATNGLQLASTSSDETIKIYDHSRNIQIADLAIPTDLPNAISRSLCFTKKHLLACHDHGQITMWSRDSWLLVHTLKSSSQKGISGIAVHPSEKLAFSVGGDSKLRLWDLIRGKGGKVLPLSFIPEGILFLNDSSFVVMSRRGLEGFKLDLSSFFSHKSTTQLNCLCLFHSNLIVGCDNGSIKVFDVSSGDVVKEFVAHEKRVKAVYAVSDYLISASSDGSVHIWDKDFNKVMELQAPEENRITCMVAMESAVNASVKDTAKFTEESNESESDSDSSESSDESTEKATTSDRTKRARVE
ncbi:Shk1 kinase binding protein 15 [Schizosaccharomyces cryophilus OY26]|uniref:Shk1 kinase binding protein 15 n=1 Tax=Schizosaccharomyces cryophilus (strain OY26 / ATCC MYA-4695 / CBS 11777 / NBRC 106824 / NRRL Y48691) TaxID=653667 RepID=S9VPL6_SCHCR|nr:Shk1 kinase binding protein 15 [Schizosaccharomyces cryophilus OY26]EPY49873.1 Shk1 kinase binding protein 15 [Schizosaccharomyces cryophilus OY26]